ncbi:DUF2946 family protein [Uliginosibacterium sediminicola]|uniref:DUF2946 family protein n=1 Tax=Uliginosibacterium sediminicola TaxID=2024550 RepID=A0ABU9YX08_9RHOO
MLSFLRARSLRQTAWLAIFAILLHAFAPLAHARMATQSLLSSICTTDGARLEVIALPDAPQKLPAVDLSKHCPLCMAGAHFALADRETRAFEPDHSLRHVRISLSQLPAVRVAVWRHFSPRAPPQA